LAGFFSAEGCFFIHITKSNTKVGYAVRLKISINQHKKDELLLESIINTINCGILYKHSENAVVLTIQTFHDINNIIIPLLKKYKIKGIKYLDFKDFCFVTNLMKQKVHLTQEGFELIYKIKSGMNKGRL
jgi:LAGLIDADG endonuclease